MDEDIRNFIKKYIYNVNQKDAIIEKRWLPPFFLLTRTTFIFNKCKSQGN